MEVKGRMLTVMILISGINTSRDSQGSLFIISQSKQLLSHHKMVLKISHNTLAKILLLQRGMMHQASNCLFKAWWELQSTEHLIIKLLDTGEIALGRLHSF